MNFEEIIYTISIALQVSGSVFLLLYFWGNTKDRIIREYYPGTNIASRDEKGNITLEKEKLQDSAIKIYKNRIAFIILAAGYLIGIFGKNEGKNNMYIALIAIGLTISILYVVDKGCGFIAKKIYSADLQIPYESVKKDVDTIATKNEIDHLFQ